MRSAELHAFVPEALNEHAVTAMHDMRIAAKRLRYVLELIGFCLGDVGAEAQARARELQEVLGDIHDCDVMLERIAASHAREPAGFDALAARFAARARGTSSLASARCGRRSRKSGLRDRPAREQRSFHLPAAAGGRIIHASCDERH